MKNTNKTVTVPRMHTHELEEGLVSNLDDEYEEEGETHLLYLQINPIGLPTTVSFRYLEHFQYLTLNS